MASTNDEPDSNESAIHIHQNYVEPWTLDQLVSMRDEIVLQEDENYLAVSKPADLRMDGPQVVTLQKVLLSWFPSNSMLEMSVETRKKFILSLCKWSDVKDNELRHCHQLDYATSGVLLFAKSKEAAAAAGHSFQARLAKKSYLALVHGHIDLKSFESRVNDSEDNPLTHWENGKLEDEYRKDRRRIFRGKNSFKGFLPTHAVFENWKSKTRSLLKKDAKIPIRENNDCLILLTPEERDEILGMKWSEVKTNIRYRDMFEEFAKELNCRKKETLEIETESEGNVEVSRRKRQHPDRNPYVFRLVHKTKELDDLQEKEETEAIFIQCNIAAVKDQFRMMFDVKAISTSSNYGMDAVDHYRSFGDHIDLSKLDFKPSLTKFRVLWQGYLKGKPVSKVLLYPKTGRRHQLRIHTVVAGHPIVGDATYELPIQSESNICNRMCLHAYRLSIPLLHGKVFDFHANDPFYVSSNTVSVGGGPRC